MSLKDLIKNHAYELGADLVGVGDIGRCRHAPPMMSPQGLYPGAKSVIVMAVRHPDACIERGGERHPQEIGPYSVQYLMNARLDEMSYRMATFVEKQGHGAMPIVSSNIWRYNEYKDLKAVFAPDVSHIYMAVVAGLAEIGFSGLALTPEYGARNRFITVITDAELEPDPLIPPGTVCDRCMLCRKHCPSGALSKEIDGEKVLKIDPYEYRFPNKNLWRCAWGEHFDLDLDLKIPEKVDEAVILREVAAHGIRSGEMGQCLKFCVPKGVRHFDPAYSKTPMRTHWATCNAATMSRAVVDRLLSRPLARGAEALVAWSADELRGQGVDLEAVLPGAQSAVVLAVAAPAGTREGPFGFGASYQIDSLCYDLTRQCEELGFRSLMTAGGPPHPEAELRAKLTKRVADLPGFSDRIVFANLVVTCLPVPSQQRRPAPVSRPGQTDAGDATNDIATNLCDLARSLGADLVGVAPVARIDELADQLRPVYAGETVLDAKDRSIRFTPWEPQISERARTVSTAADHLPGARAVFVFGLRYHAEVLRWATRPPAEAVGPYAFQTYVTHWLGAIIGYQLVKRLEELGHTGVMTMDLHGTESFTASPRGPQPDLFANRFAGLAAGLGYLTTSGHLATPAFGIRQRLIAIVTDAPLAPSPMRAPVVTRCAACDQRCIAACPSHAITDRRVALTCGGHSFAFNRIDARRCDWVKRYALMGDSGFRYLGSKLNVVPGATITEKALADALRQHDTIKKYRPVVAEPCVLRCPLATPELTRA